ncbi:hypothetical protein DENIS_4782 [Desulfonema ishimotonii]|uniref:Uncharacterized protein n=1 Tax=Desulfonema ishimotonii TaxID=45657 RepID=A0A401G3I9_9BACT|nr:hypothetical protein [Desulfonema ishimotonii]GBC63784.1 hypothetical protein DENIS_4782 [Desulfonema ishimotonii]
MNPTSAEERSGFALPIDIAMLTALITALFYTAGWAFAYRYFEKFHVGLLTLELPREYYFVYSLWVAQDNLVLMIAVLILALFFGGIILAAWRQFGQYAAIIRKALILLSPLILLAFFCISYNLGTSTANARFAEQKQTDYPDYPRIRVNLLPQKDNSDLIAVQKSLKKGCYRLLLQNRDKLFLFYSLKKAPSASLPLVIIPMTQVHSLRILPHYNSCGS